MNVRQRLVAAATLVGIVLAIAFPVKQTVVWSNGQWRRWNKQGFLSSETGERFTPLPTPRVGPIGREFLLEDRQRVLTFLQEDGKTTETHFKEVPGRQRMVFDVLLIMVAGGLVSFALRSPRRRLQPRSE